MEMLKNRKKIA